MLAYLDDALPVLAPLRHALAGGDDALHGLVQALLHLVQGRLHDDVGDGQRGVRAEERPAVLLGVAVQRALACDSDQQRFLVFLFVSCFRQGRQVLSTGVNVLAEAGCFQIVS